MLHIYKREYIDEFRNGIGNGIKLSLVQKEMSSYAITGASKGIGLEFVR